MKVWFSNGKRGFGAEALAFQATSAKRVIFVVTPISSRKSGFCGSSPILGCRLARHCPAPGRYQSDRMLGRSLSNGPPLLPAS
jgi:hypothetical protein